MVEVRYCVCAHLVDTTVHKVGTAQVLIGWRHLSPPDVYNSPEYPLPRLPSHFPSINFRTAISRGSSDTVIVQPRWELSAAFAFV